MHEELAPLIKLWHATRQAREGHHEIQAAFDDLAQDGAPPQQARLRAERDSDRAQSRRLYEQGRAVTAALAGAARDLTDILGRPLVVDIPSDTRPGLIHHVIFLEDEAVCTCEGFNAWYHCKHLSRADAVPADGRTLVRV
jgi:hypothetical protein